MSSSPAADTLAAGVGGRVTLDGAGLGDVKVRLTTEGGETHEARTFVGRRDQRGFFSFRNVPPGNHTVAVDVPTGIGIVFSDSVHDAVVRSSGERIRLRFDGALQKSSELHGQVRDPDGGPAAGVRVRARGYPLEGYPTEFSHVMDSLRWSATAVTDEEGRYSIAAPPGWYRVSIWREEWLTSLDFTTLQYRTVMPVLPPGERERVDFDFRDFRTSGCRVGELSAERAVERRADRMACGEALHPDISHFEIWTFEARAGEQVQVVVDAADPSPLLLMDPDGVLMESHGGRAMTAVRGSGEGTEPSGEQRITVVPERSGTHSVLVTSTDLPWKVHRPYRIRLSTSGP